jgi:thiamine pyrophosphate-dependent acetolactate synthase large subunit-like protein
MGCHGVTADSPAALRDALGAALQADRPTVIQVATA